MSAGLTLALLTFWACQPAPQTTEPPPVETSSERPQAPSNTPVPAQTETPKPIAEAPTDFPLPLYEGLQVVDKLTTEREGRFGSQLELVGEVDPQQVVAFYEREFQKRGLTVRKGTAHAQSHEEALLLGQSETITAGLMITGDESGKKRVLLSWSEQKQK